MNKISSSVCGGRNVVRSLAVMGLSASLAVLSQFASAACSYNVDNEWSTGFVASITIKNDTNATINGWNVNWQFANNRMAGGWNANFSGTNPYSATNMSWNGSIAPGQSVSFGVQGEKPNGAAAERPAVTGAACNGGVTLPVSSTPSSTPRSSVAPSSIAASSIAPSSLPKSSSSAVVSSSSVSNQNPNCPSEPQSAFQMYAPKVPVTVQAEDFDPAGYSDSDAANQGGAYRTDTGVDIKQITGGNALGWMTAGEWLEYTFYVETEGDYDVTIRSGSISDGRTLKVTQCNTTLIESFAVPKIANWGEFKTWSAGKVRFKPGYQKIRVTVGAQDYLDLDWIHIGPYSGPLDPTTSSSSSATSSSAPGTPGGVVRSDGCGKTPSLQNGRLNLNVNGLNRSYILRVPSNYNNQNPYRLIVGYHWLNGDATQVANGGNGSATETPYYGLWNLAQNSTIFVAPEGIDKGWANSGGRDLAFTDAMLAQLQSNLCIDKSRIFATGFSYGGGMSNAIACARANVFRGVALYSGAQLSGCDGGTAPIPFFAAHGLGDDVLNISLGRSLRDRAVRNNRCNAQNPLEPARGSGTHICTSYQGCSAGYPVRWCAFDGGHWPSQHDTGQPESWIPQEAWRFISQF